MHGLGKMKSDTLKSEQIACQTTRIATDSSHGAAFSSLRCWSVIMRPPFLADRADALAQVVHDVR